MCVCVYVCVCVRVGFGPGLGLAGVDLCIRACGGEGGTLLHTSCSAAAFPGVMRCKEGFPDLYHGQQSWARVTMFQLLLLLLSSARSYPASVFTSNRVYPPCIPFPTFRIGLWGGRSTTWSSVLSFLWGFG